MTGRPVVVGVDGSPDAARAVAWATVEAMRRRRPLQVLAVLPAHGVSSAFLASDAADEARRAVPELAVSADVRRGDPLEALLEAGRDAELLVVGSRGRGTIGSLVLGSVSAALAARAGCPTVVVRGTRVPAPDDPVVVGIDGTRSGEAAVGYAFAAADREGVPLVAVHVWQDVHDPELGSMLDDDVSPPAAEGMPDLPEAELLAERLAGWSSKFPDVEVLRVLPEGWPVPTLAAHSGEARLLVVGSHRRRGLERVLGSVGQAVLRRAHCPVAVVPPSTS